jgi:surface antigen
LPYYVIFSLEDGNCTDWAYHERPDIYEDRSPSDTNSNWDAWTWDEHARLEGLTVNETPEVGAIVVWPISGASPVGHVAYVEAVNLEGDGGHGEIVVSEMNDAGATEEEMHYYEGIWPYDIRPVQDPSSEGVSYIHQR